MTEDHPDPPRLESYGHASAMLAHLIELGMGAWVDYDLTYEVSEAAFVATHDLFIDTYFALGNRALIESDARTEWTRSE